MVPNRFNIVKDNESKITDNFLHKINIIYSADNNFSEILGVSLVSLYENNALFSSIDVYVIDENISEDNKKKLQSISSNYNRSPIKWIRYSNLNNLLKISIKTDRGSLSQFSRLMVGTLLPAKLDRVIYLDCDIIVNNSLKELWQLELNGSIIAALEDCFSKHYRKNLELPPTATIFNSGVLLIDLQSWRSQRIEKKLLDYIKQKKGKVQQSDQGVLSAVLSEECKIIDPKFNAVTIFFDFNYQEILSYRRPPKKYYSEEIINNAINHPYIIHYTSSFMSKRPWMKGCKHRYAYKWLFYKDLSPWSNTPLRKDNRSKLKLFFFLLAKILPRKALIFVASIFQAYVRPWKNSFI